jgi:hypothetical protein
MTLKVPLLKSHVSNLILVYCPLAGLSTFTNLLPLGPSLRVGKTVAKVLTNHYTHEAISQIWGLLRLAFALLAVTIMDRLLMY